MPLEPVYADDLQICVDAARPLEHHGVASAHCSSSDAQEPNCGASACSDDAASGSDAWELCEGASVGCQVVLSSSGEVLEDGCVNEACGSASLGSCVAGNAREPNSGASACSKDPRSDGCATEPLCGASADCQVAAGSSCAKTTCEPVGEAAEGSTDEAGDGCAREPTAGASADGQDKPDSGDCNAIRPGIESADSQIAALCKAPQSWLAFAIEEEAPAARIAMFAGLGTWSAFAASCPGLVKVRRLQAPGKAAGNAGLLSKRARKRPKKVPPGLAAPVESSQSTADKRALERAGVGIADAARHGMDKELLALLRKKLQAASSAEQVRVVEQACKIWCEPPRG